MQQALRPHVGGMSTRWHLVLALPGRREVKVPDPQPPAHRRAETSGGEGQGRRDRGRGARTRRGECAWSGRASMLRAPGPTAGSPRARPRSCGPESGAGGVPRKGQPGSGSRGRRDSDRTQTRCRRGARRGLPRPRKAPRGALAGPPRGPPFPLGRAGEGAAARREDAGPSGAEAGVRDASGRPPNAGTWATRPAPGPPAVRRAESGRRSRSPKGSRGGELGRQADPRMLGPAAAHKLVRPDGLSGFRSVGGAG